MARKVEASVGARRALQRAKGVHQDRERPPEDDHQARDWRRGGLRQPGRGQLGDGRLERSRQADSRLEDALRRPQGAVGGRERRPQGARGGTRVRARSVAAARRELDEARDALDRARDETAKAREKAKAGAARRRELEAETADLREKLAALKEKSDHDDRSSRRSSRSWTARISARRWARRPGISRGSPSPRLFSNPWRRARWRRRRSSANKTARCEPSAPPSPLGRSRGHHLRRRHRRRRRWGRIVRRR